MLPCRIEKELDDADRQIGDKMHVIDLDNDGLIRWVAPTMLACMSAHLVLACACDWV